MAGMKDPRLPMDGGDMRDRRRSSDRNVKPVQPIDDNLDNLFKTRQNLLMGEGIENMSDYLKQWKQRVNQPSKQKT